MALRIALVLAAACSGGKAKAVEDARRPPPGDAAPAVRDAVADDAKPRTYRVDPNVKVGDVQLRVEWKDVPAAVRASPARTACGTARAPSVAPTTTWGIPDALVSIDVDHGKAPSPPRARIVLEQCALSPRVAITSATLAIASASESPATLALAKHAALPLGATPATTAARNVYLPIAGHEVEATLEAGTIYAIRDAAPDGDVAYVVSADTPYLAVTEVTGQVVLRDVPVGTHAVRAWLPPRAGQPAKLARGTVTVAAGALAEVTLALP